MEQISLFIEGRHLDRIFFFIKTSDNPVDVWNVEKAALTGRAKALTLH